jgi:diguanylate cyclase (GGDEF)-like protein
LTVGAIAFPQHGARAQDLLERAEAALDTARSQGPGSVFFPPVEGGGPAGRAPAAAARRDTRGLLDERTGVLREERFGMALHKVVARQRLADQPVSVVVLAIDQLDQVEQRYGRGVADQLLKIVADLLSEGTRELDLLARSGPAGFALSLDCAPEQALVAARRMASAARQLPPLAGAPQVRITLSGGVAGHPDHTGQALPMWRYAQAALQAAQERGRNLILPFASDMALAAEPAPPGVDVF